MLVDFQSTLIQIQVNENRGNNGSECQRWRSQNYCTEATQVWGHTDGACTIQFITVQMNEVNDFVNAFIWPQLEFSFHKSWGYKKIFENLEEEIHTAHPSHSYNYFLYFPPILDLYDNSVQPLTHLTLLTLLTISISLWIDEKMQSIQLTLLTLLTLLTNLKLIGKRLGPPIHTAHPSHSTHWIHTT